MLLSLELIYYGDCKDMIRFYLNTFVDASAEIHLYREMPQAEALGISGSGLDMVWRAVLTIRYGDYAVRFRLSDSLLTARKMTVTCTEQTYHPLICIEHPDEPYMRGLLEKLYCGGHCFEDIQKGIYSDRYGIRWVYKRGECHRVYHCLELIGNCNEVAAYIGNAYQVPLTEMVRYADSSYAHVGNPAAQDKGYGVLMEVQEQQISYAVSFSDAGICNDSGYGNGYGKNKKLWYQIILVVEETDEAYLKEAFRRLSDGATLNRPISRNEEGRLYGSMIDRYGIVWELLSRIP